METLKIGLAVKAVTIHKSMERNNEPYWTVYAGTDASVQDGDAVRAMSHALRRVRRGERHEFAGLGMLVLPPVEIQGKLLAWHVELWESDQGARKAGEALDKATAIGAKKAVKMARKIATSTTAAAVAAVGAVAQIAGKLLRENGDDLMLTWAGSLFVDDIDQYLGKSVTINSDRATVELRIISG